MSHWHKTEEDHKGCGSDTRECLGVEKPDWKETEIAILKATLKDTQIQLQVALVALAEAGKRFASNDMEGVRLLLCDMNARTNAAALIQQKAAALKEDNTSNAKN